MGRSVLGVLSAVVMAIATATPAAATVNLLIGGDFENFNPANPGFSSSYYYPTAYDRVRYGPNGTQWPRTLLWDEGSYDITTNPALEHTKFASFAAHGGSNMMVVNGDGRNMIPIWVQGPVDVTPGAVYTFSVWLAGVDLPRPDLPAMSNPANNPARLNLTMITNGGQTLDTITQAPFVALTTVGVWQQYSVEWTATASQVTLALWNANTSAIGNDFAMDDLSLVLLRDVASTPPGGAGSPPEPDPDPDAGPGPDPGTGPGSPTETDPDPDAGPGPDPGTGPGSPPETDPDLEGDPDPGPGPGGPNGPGPGGGWTPAAVPEPASWVMMLIGTGAAGGLLRRRRSLAPV